MSISYENCEINKMDRVSFLMAASCTSITSVVLTSFAIQIFLTCPTSATTVPSHLVGVTSCLQSYGVFNYTTDQSASFSGMVNFSLQNLRFTEASVRRPGVLILPDCTEDVQKAFVCSHKNGWQVRVRSGGHSYEGLSSTADTDFVIIDLRNMDKISVDLHSETAWVEAGATLGQLYYQISQVTSNYGFPAGTCATVGCGGHFSGGGYGLLSRKYGVAADNVIDAKLIDSRGHLLDRKAMGEDLFWALRGGGGGIWGIVVIWKIKLVRVPSLISIFSLTKTGRQEVSELIFKWQKIAPTATEALYLGVSVSGTNESGIIDTAANFLGQYLGRCKDTIALIDSIYPELGLVQSDCKEISWINATAQIAGRNITTLGDRYSPDKNFFKAKSDYVTTPISAEVLQEAFKIMEGNLNGYIILDPYGGVMDEISPSAIAFPHRAGNLYAIQYQAVWGEQDREGDAFYIDWLRRFYDYMTPYVSKNPRAAYVNYLDLDLGTVASSDGGQMIEKQAKKWGEKYFCNNFQRLVEIKHRFDPSNVFTNAQTL